MPAPSRSPQNTAKNQNFLSEKVRAHCATPTIRVKKKRRVNILERALFRYMYELRYQNMGRNVDSTQFKISNPSCTSLAKI